MDTEARFRMLEASIANLRDEVAAERRKSDALETVLLFFISLSDRINEGPAAATAGMLEDLAADLKRKKDSENADDLERFTANLRMVLDARARS